MSGNDPAREDTTIYKVVVNEEDQYSIWPADREEPRGWRDAGKSGTKAECLSYIQELWLSMRPLSWRKKMEEMANNPPPPKEKSAVDILCEGSHPVEVGLRPEKTVERFKAMLVRGYAHINFTAIGSGIELDMKLDLGDTDFSQADFKNASGVVRLVGTSTLNSVRVRCSADIDLSTLAGSGYLEKLE